MISGYFNIFVSIIYIYNRKGYMTSLRDHAATQRAQLFAEAATASYLKYQWEVPPNLRNRTALLSDSKGILREEYLNRHNFSLDERKKYEYPKVGYNRNFPKQREIYDAAWSRILDEDMDNRIKGQISVMRGEIESVPFSIIIPFENNHSGGKPTRSNRKYKKTTRKSNRK